MADAAIADIGDAEPLTLFDLDPELILEALATLPARDQAKARLTCKLFHVLVAEIARTTTFMKGHYGSAGEIGFFDEVNSHLETAPSMGILFSENTLPEAFIEEHVQKYLPYPMELVGGDMSVVAGTKADTGELKQSGDRPGERAAPDTIGLTLGHFPEATVKSFAIDVSKSGTWQEQLQAEGAMAEGWKVFLVIARHRETPDIIDHLQNAHPSAAIIGGMATGSALYRIKKGEVDLIENQGVVGLMFSGDVPLAAFVSRGARSLCDGHYTFNGGVDVQGGGEEMNHTLITHLTSTNRGERKPALECLMECCANLPRGMGPSIGIATEDGNGYQLESLSNDMIVPQQQAILVPGSWGQEDDTGMPTSGCVKFYGFDAESCKLDLTKRLNDIKTDAEAKGDRMLGAVMFTCGGRTGRFFGEPAFDASTFAKTFKSTPLIGMYAGGEIGPPLLADAPISKAFQFGGAGMHGFTAIFGLFIVPKRKARESLLAFAGDEEIAQAFSELRRLANEAGTVPPPPPPPSAASSSSSLPSSLSELRALPIKALKAAMSRLGLTATPGSEKEDLVMEIAAAKGMSEE